MRKSILQTHSTVLFHIPTATRSFESYVQSINETIKELQITIHKLKDAFFPLKISKSTGYDELSVNVIKIVFVNFVIGDRMKIANVTPVFEGGDSADLCNNRPISVLSCFSKILERLMYNRLYKHLKGHSTDHALLQLVDQIYESFERNEYTIGVFIDLSKAFDTVDHNILLKK